MILRPALLRNRSFIASGSWRLFSLEYFKFFALNLAVGRKFEDLRSPSLNQNQGFRTKPQPCPEPQDLGDEKTGRWNPAKGVYCVAVGSYNENTGHCARARRGRKIW